MALIANSSLNYLLAPSMRLAELDQVLAVTRATSVTRLKVPNDRAALPAVIRRIRALLS